MRKQRSNAGNVTKSGRPQSQAKASASEGRAATAGPISMTAAAAPASTHFIGISYMKRARFRPRDVSSEEKLQRHLILPFRVDGGRNDSHGGIPDRGIRYAEVGMVHHVE